MFPYTSRNIDDELAHNRLAKLRMRKKPTFSHINLYLYNALDSLRPLKHGKRDT